MEKTMRNPHKGWYVHQLDNTLKYYGTSFEEDPLEDFPGLDHLYLRLAWSYLEPEEGVYRWEVIDNEIERWVKSGLSIAFRITCKETHDNQTFATPRWVMEAGAKGLFLSGEGCNIWEPDYGDPIFLEKLEAFHKAFAARYDGQSWLAYVDIGSYGDWGEAHTSFGSKQDWPVDIIVAHLDLHCRCYRHAQLVISDDVASARNQSNDEPEYILLAIRERGITLRDDGISVEWFAERFGESTLRNPEYFEPFWRDKPIVLELEHYHFAVRTDCWQEGIPLMHAVRETHATYAGFHGYPRKWLEENRDYAARLSNQLGYWFFPKSVSYADKWSSGSKERLRIVWQNRGSAPAYHAYKLFLRMSQTDMPHMSQILELEGSNCRNWMPGCVFGETYRVVVPEEWEQGTYSLSIKLIYSNESDVSRAVELGLQDALRDQDGFYKIGNVEVM
ncbi:DUF4832 domain-containing protein [Paenibacillus sp. CF384]|uniref:DUF4832 domain-containing protein n=1 Tax=Paenibacillus sp. CF384 TaxID=1884382 RepID=UPI0015A6CCDE|nr:DUF4832 domain-containing protein [Paenibacillus sp. CF384]